MGVFSWPGPERPLAARRSIRFTFAAVVAVPIVCLVVLWILAVSATIGRALAEPSLSSQNHRHLVQYALVIGMGLAILIVSVILMGWFARRLSRDITDLETSAQHLADEKLPRLVEQLRRGKQVSAADEQPIRLRTTTAEIARAASAIASLQQTAVAAAAGEAGLRNGIGQVFVSLARRNQSLLQRQLRLIDTLERKASDPAALADLFPLDHLTTRMRRHAEGLIILSGAAPGRSWSEPVPVIDVLRGAVAEVEDYKRVTVITSAEDAVAGSAVADMIHLLAELIENATLFSPSGMRVEVRAERVANGFAVEIEDRGLGIKTGQMNAINQRLATPPDFDLANADQLGLFVVGKLASRHAVRVSLRPSPYGGTSAIVLMPNSIVMSVSELEAGSRPDARPAIGGSPTLDLRSVEALTLADQSAAQPSLSASAGDQSAAGPDTFGLAGESFGLEPGLPGGPAGAPDRLTAAARDRLTSPDRLTAAARDRLTSPDRLTAAARDRLTAPDRPAAGSADSADSLALEGLAPDGVTRASYAEPPPAATYRGLPRRVRQASLSPHLREGPSPAADRPPVPDSSLSAVGRTPEQARDLVASMQTGWQRGRQTEAPTAETGTRDSSSATIGPRDSAGTPTGPRGGAGVRTGMRDSAGTPTGPRDSAGAPTGPRDSAGAPTGPRDSAGTPTGPRGGAGVRTGMRDSAGSGITGDPAPGTGTGARSTDAPVRKGGTGTPASGAARAGSRPGAHAARRGESETQQSEEG